MDKNESIFIDELTLKEKETIISFIKKIKPNVYVFDNI